MDGRIAVYLQYRAFSGITKSDGEQSKASRLADLAVLLFSPRQSGRCSRRDSNSYIPIVVLRALLSVLLLAQLYLLLPWSRTFRHLTTRDGGNAIGLLGTILAL